MIPLLGVGSDYTESHQIAPHKRQFEVVYVNRAANECGLSQRGGALSSFLSAGRELGVDLLTPPVLAGRGHTSLAENADLRQRQILK